MTVPTERQGFRLSVGILAILGGLGGLAGLYFVEVPQGNREPLLLALGLVLGWGSTVIGYEFGSSPAGRAAANVGIRQAEASAGEPQQVVVTNSPGDPVNVKEEPTS